MRDYFEAEMRLLNDSMVSTEPCDPSVERLLEGFAYLTARIRERMDEDLPDITQTFLEQLCPELLRPYPSIVMLECSGVSQPTILPKGSLVQSERVGEEQVACQFMTTHDVIINPVELQSVLIEPSVHGGSILKFKLKKLNNHIKLNLNLNNIKFYLHGDKLVILDLYLAVTGNVKKNNITIKPIGLADSDSLGGLALLRDYFLGQEKYLGFEIEQLDTLEFDIYTRSVFSSDRVIDKHNFKLHCVPAVNCYPYDGEPFECHDNTLDYYKIVPDHYYPESIVLHDIKALSCLDDGGKKQILDNYQVRYTNQLYLSGELIKSGRIISPALWVSNGHYPKQYIKENQIAVLINNNKKITINNMARPSRYYMAPDRSTYAWELIRVLNFNINALKNKDDLIKVLNLVNWGNNIKITDNIVCLTVNYSTGICQGGFIKNIDYKLNINEKGFICLGEIYLLGSVLHEFFKIISPINYGINTCITVSPSGETFSW